MAEDPLSVIDTPSSEMATTESLSIDASDTLQPETAEPNEQLASAVEAIIPVATGVTLSAIGLPDTRSVRARRWSRLSSIKVTNFKAIKEATIPLGM